MPLTTIERRTILRIERGRDVAVITAAIKVVLRNNAAVTLDEIEAALRAAASSAYLIGTASGFEIVIGFSAWRSALAEAGMSAESNRQKLARRR